MKKRYTKKQICEAISYWKKQLKKLNESLDDHSLLTRKFKEFCKNYVKTEDDVIELIEDISDILLNDWLQGDYERRNELMDDTIILASRVKDYFENYD